MDEYFEIGTSFLDGYFLNEPVPYMLIFKLPVFWTGSKKNFMSNSQFGRVTGKNFVMLMDVAVAVR